MGAPDILGMLTAKGLKLRPLPNGDIEVSPRSVLTDEIRAVIRANKSELIRALLSPADPTAAAVDPEAQAEAQAAAELTRRLRVQMDRRPDLDLVVLADDELIEGAVLIAVGRRGAFVCCLRIAPDRYDGMKLLDLVQRHGGTVH